MPNWLIGKALAPFVLALLAYFVTRPAQRWVERRLPGGRFKRFLLIHSERNRFAFGVAAVLANVLLIALCTWSSFTVR